MLIHGCGFFKVVVVILLTLRPAPHIYIWSMPEKKNIDQVGGEMPVLPQSSVQFVLHLAFFAVIFFPPFLPFSLLVVCPYILTVPLRQLHHTQPSTQQTSVMICFLVLSCLVPRVPVSRLNILTPPFPACTSICPCESVCAALKTLDEGACPHYIN